MRIFAILLFGDLGIEFGWGACRKYEEISRLMQKGQYQTTIILDIHSLTMSLSLLSIGFIFPTVHWNWQVN